MIPYDNYYFQIPQTYCFCSLSTCIVVMYKLLKPMVFFAFKRLNFPCHVSLDKTLILNLSYNQSGIWQLLSLNVIPLDRGN